MLQTLSVENYALIDHLELTLGAGLNTVTGETGAGKSILLGALGLLLGTRGEAGVQKDPSRACVVEGVFELKGDALRRFFEENDLEFEPTVTMRRVISASGKSRAYVGDLPVPIATLRALGERLVDIHSQHENLLLRDDGFRLSTLDAAAGHATAVKRYGEAFAAWRACARQLAALRAESAEARREEEWLRHQAGELAALRLREGEQAELEAEQTELTHSDDLREAFSLAAGELGADETGVTARVAAIRTAMERVAGIHAGAESLARRLASACLEFRDMEREAADLYERVEGNPERLAAIGERLDAIYTLQQKHRVSTVEALVELQEEFTRRLDAIDSSSEQEAELEGRLAAARAEVETLAAEISAGRHRAAPGLESGVVEMLRSLGMPEARFVVQVTPAELRTDGGDEVRFLFTANGSMPPRAIEKIASGGEISRVMLALKTISMRSAGQTTIVFDEIDTGVSGRIADAMGEVIVRLSGHSQVVNITHLPQIAAKGGEHFLVYKQDGATHIRQLSGEERVAEIAKMLSGSTVTAAAIGQARELLGKNGTN